MSRKLSTLAGLASSAAEPGAAVVEGQRLDLSELVRQAAADVVPFARTREGSLALFADSPVPIDGNAVALAALVRNLADNALRYSPLGSQVELHVLDDAGTPLLRVDDAGPGIPAEERERVFDRFYRRAGSDAPGSGLGLSIVRSVAEQHGARVTLGTSPLGGLRVSVRFVAA